MLEWLVCVCVCWDLGGDFANESGQRSQAVCCFGAVYRVQGLGSRPAVGRGPLN